MTKDDAGDYVNPTLDLRSDWQLSVHFVLLQACSMVEATSDMQNKHKVDQVKFLTTKI